MMPQLGETVTEGTITRWMKAVGDAVERDEPLFEVSTDKVDSEVPSPAAGVLSEILVPEGETVEVGVKLAVIGDGAAPASTQTRPRRQLSPHRPGCSRTPAGEPRRVAPPPAPAASPPPPAAPAAPPAPAPPHLPRRRAAATAPRTGSRSGAPRATGTAAGRVCSHPWCANCWPRTGSARAR